MFLLRGRLCRCNLKGFIWGIKRSPSEVLCVSVVNSEHVIADWEVTLHTKGSADFFTFTNKILNEKLHILDSVTKIKE